MQRLMILSKGKLFLLSGLILWASSLWAQGYRIEVEIQGVSGDTLILGEHFTSRMVPKDTLVLDQGGKGSFTGQEALSGGLYLIYIDQDHYFDFFWATTRSCRSARSRSTCAGFRARTSTRWHSTRARCGWRERRRRCYGADCSRSAPKARRSRGSGLSRKFQGKSFPTLG